MKIKPFREGDTYSTFANLIEKVRLEIKSLENEYVLKASASELESYFVDKVLIEPLVLHTDQYAIENQTGITIDAGRDISRIVFPGDNPMVRGTRLDIAIPFEGNPELWRLRPSSWSSGYYPEIDVRNDSIMFSVAFADGSAESQQISKEINDGVSSLAGAVSTIAQEVKKHNQSVPEIIRSTLARKRDLAQSTLGIVNALGIPMLRRNKPLTYAFLTQRRESPVTRPRVTAEQYQAEPFLEEKEYQHILEVMRGMSFVIERSPDVFASLDEEAIRTHFLLQLNGHYEGGATGETFNAAGKTDILIRVNGRNIFIAECKFWRGAKGYNDAIDQLLGYLTWRDSKCALLIFNQTKDSDGVRKKMHEEMESRKEFRRTISHDTNGDSRYVFVKETEPGREIIITTQLYDVPVRA